MPEKRPKKKPDLRLPKNVIKRKILVNNDENEAKKQQLFYHLFIASASIGTGSCCQGRAIVTILTKGFC